MDRELCIFICDNFVDDLRQIIGNMNRTDIVVHGISLNCTGPLVDPKDLMSRMEKCSKKFCKVIIFGSSCIYSMKKAMEDLPNVEFVSQNHCFEHIVPPKLIEHYLQNQYYLVSAGWFKNYEQNLANWGFQPEQAKAFFRETVKEIVFLDTDLDFKNPELLEDLSQYMGVPYKIISIGSDYLRSKLDTLIIKWDIEFEREARRLELSAATKQNADYAMVFHQINTLLGLTDEQSLLEKVFLFTELLFAPEDIAFIPPDATPDKWQWFKQTDPDRLSKSDQFFPIDTEFNGEKMGQFRIYEVKFPSYIDQYKESLDVIKGMIGLAFSNVKKYEVIKENEQKLSQQKEELSENIRIKNKFFSVVAHDLRSPFNNILGLLSVLEEDYHDFDDDYRLKMLQQINHSANSYFQLLENLLEWAGTQTGKMRFNPQKIDLYDIVEDCIDLFKNSFRIKEVHLSNRVVKGTWLNADKNMATSIIRNLISNALKFTPNGGQVRIEPIQDDPAHPEKSVFCISDTGVGMTPEIISRLFIEGEKVHSKGTDNESGSGLGLLLVSEMIKAHGGEIKVKSTPGTGSCFTFSLPKYT